ncbi:hypothetical protein F5Y17DRAFT_78123 [Xylariaceae sp. FL0594]|nr:hypothetical protein F5Y17DRAFT_78123 [Xylariaceae sp. FL0594]
MGSLEENSPCGYPDASDPSLVLTHPTEAEKRQTWSMNHDEWGGSLSLEEYMEREPFLASTPLAANGAMTHWILTDSASPSSPGQKRRVLASCETIRKPVLYVPAGGTEVQEGYGYGIGSVYTPPEFRGRKYAARMLKDLGEVLRTWPAEELRRQQEARGRGDTQGPGDGNADADAADNHVKGEEQAPLKSFCSTLWSDIGKKYYATKGWPAFPSEHVEFPTLPVGTYPPATSNADQLVYKIPHLAESGYSPIDLRSLDYYCREDEAQLRRQMIKHAQETGRAAFAYVPTPEVFHWHWARQDFLSAREFPGRKSESSSGLAFSIGTRPPSTPAPTPGEVKSENYTSGAQSGNEVAIKIEGEDKEAVTKEEDAPVKRLRMWAIWARNYGKDAANHPERNTLYILRFVIDDGYSASPNINSSTPGEPDRRVLQAAFDTILDTARRDAQRWNCGKVQLWNPDPLVRELAKATGLPHRFVDRDDSVPSLMWYRDEDESQIDWFANEKFCWC